MRYVFIILLNSMMLSCPSQPDTSEKPAPQATPDPTGGDQLPAPRVEFVDAPSGNSTATTLSIKVKGANTATKEYAYAFVSNAGGVNCKDQMYSTWYKFSQPISISATSATKMGAPGKKTLCAKGRRADKTVQQEPTKHEWTLVADNGGGGEEPAEEASLTVALSPTSAKEKTGSSQAVAVTVTFADFADADKSATVTLTVTCNNGITAPTVAAKNATDGEVEWDVAVPISKAGECEFVAEANLGNKAKSEATFTIEEGEEPDNDPDETPKGLHLSQSAVKFASTNKDVQTIMLRHDGKTDADIDWVVTTDHEELLFKVRNKGDSDWIDLVNGHAAIEGSLTSKGSTHDLEFKLAHPSKTDYGGDQQVAVTISDGTDDMTLTLHILAPKLEITGDADDAITEKSEYHWHVVLTNSDKIKTLSIANTNDDPSSVLDWDVFPYRWKPAWFDYEKDVAAGTLTLKKLGDEVPGENDNKKITLIIASNSDSQGIKARSFALFKAGQKVTWNDGSDPKVTQTIKIKTAKWPTNDIRYVVVEFKEEE